MTSYRYTHPISADYYAPLGKDRPAYSGKYSHKEGELCPWSWSGDGNDWIPYPEGRSESGRYLENAAPYLGGDGEWHNLYWEPKATNKYSEQWANQAHYTPEPAPSYPKDKSYEHQPIAPALKEQYQTWGNPEASRIGRILAKDIGMPTKQRGKWEAKEAAWEEAIKATRNRRPSEPLSYEREEGDGNSWEPMTGDPMDALMEAEENEIREESRQYQLGLLLRSLSEKERAAITLNAEGLPRKEIAQKLRCSEESAKTYLKRARAKAAALSPKSA